MPVQYEYLLCQVQYSRVTYVNGTWQGNLPQEMDRDVDSCPLVHDFLSTAGVDGWELVSAVNQHIAPGTNFQALYFKRERLP